MYPTFYAAQRLRNIAALVMFSSGSPNAAHISPSRLSHCHDKHPPPLVGRDAEDAGAIPRSQFETVHSVYGVGKAGIRCKGLATVE